jgi:hypothetical protein
MFGIRIPLRRVIFNAVLAISPAVMLAAVSSQTAAAANYCSPNGQHSYGEACLYASPSGATFLGVAGDIGSSELSTPNNGSLLINDIWIVNPYGSPARWVEAGIFSGNLCTDKNESTGYCYSSSGYQNFRLFWADRRQNTDYYAHLEGQGQSSTFYTDKIWQWQQYPTDWFVSIGGYNDTSTSNPLEPYLIRAGTEEYPQGEGTSCSASANLDYEDDSGTWTGSWGTPSIAYDSPPYAEWFPWDALDDWAVGYESYSQAYSSCYSSNAPANWPTAPTTSVPGSPGQPGSALTEDQITQIAQQFAAGMGDQNPTLIEHVESTRQQAVLALSGDKVSSSPSVDAIVMQGQFVANNAPRPGDVSAPSGSVLVMIIDANTGALADFGLQNEVPDLANLGPVTVDK